MARLSSLVKTGRVQQQHDSRRQRVPLPTQSLDWRAATPAEGPDTSAPPAHPLTPPVFVASSASIIAGPRASQVNESFNTRVNALILADVNVRETTPRGYSGTPFCYITTWFL